MDDIRDTHRSMGTDETPGAGGDDAGDRADAPPAAAGTRRRSAKAAEAGPKPAEAIPTTMPREAPRAAGVGAGGASPSPERVEMRLSAVGRVEGGELIVDNGAVGAARVDRLAVDRGAVGAAMAGQVELSRGYARSILARQVQLDRAAARVIIAADVRADQSAAMFLIARKVDGNVRVLFDWRGALAFGAVAGVVFAVLSRVRRGGSRKR